MNFFKFFLASLAFFALFFIIPINEVRAQASGSVEDIAYCLVRNDPKNCREFIIKNNTDFETARALCDNAATEGPQKQGGLSAGPCPAATPVNIGVGGPLAGASVESLKGSAVTALNKAKFKSPVDLVNRAIRILLAFIGSISLVLYIWSGFLWMTASGNTEQVGKAKNIMVWTTLGVVMMLVSYMLASFIFKSLGV